MRILLLFTFAISYSLLPAQVFVDETTEFGLYGFVSGNGGSGISCVDYNQDGFDDLIITSQDGFVGFFINDGGTGFLPNNLLIGIDKTKMVSVIDYDNDGDLDMFFTRLNAPNKLYEQQDDGSYLDVSEDMGLSQEDTPSYGHSWGDIDADGDLDLYICNYTGADVIIVSNTLYRNQGDTFQDISEIASADNGIAASYMPTFFDYTRDGDLDLFVINDRVVYANAQLENNGNGTFADVSTVNNMADMIDAKSNTVGDYDNDGNFDVYITNSPEGNLLKRNLGFSFSDAALSTGADIAELCWGASWIDYDNDGWKDLLVSTANSPEDDSNGATHLYRNVLGAAFQLQSDEFSEDIAANTYSNATGDINNDGRLDYFTGSEEGAGVKFWYNLADAGNYLSINLTGVESNIMGVGAIIEVFADDLYSAHTVMVGNGYLSQSSYTIHAGMAENSTADLVKVTWPNGNVDHHFDINVNQSIDLVEGEGFSPAIETNTGLLEFCQGDSLQLFTNEFISYSWSTGSEENSIWVSTPGWITLEVEIAGGTLVDADPVFIGVTELADWSIEFEAPLCFPDSLTSLSLIGPDAGFVEWINPTSPPAYPPGLHEYSLLDPSGCTVSNTILTGAPEEILSNYELVLPSCFGYSDGYLTMDPTGGTGTLEVSIDCNIDSLSAGLCILEITDLLGCELSEFVVVSQPLSLSAEINSAGITDTGTGTLLAEVSGGTEDYTFFWNGEEGTASYTLTEPGLVTLEVIDAHGCTDEDQAFTTGMQDIESLHIQAFPNPTTGLIQVVGLTGDWHVTILDKMGREVYGLSGASTNATLDIEHFSNGYYTLVIQVHDGRVNKRILLMD